MQTFCWNSFFCPSDPAGGAVVVAGPTWLRCFQRDMKRERLRSGRLTSMPKTVFNHDFQHTLTSVIQQFLLEYYSFFNIHVIQWKIKHTGFFRSNTLTQKHSDNTGQQLKVAEKQRLESKFKRFTWFSLKVVFLSEDATWHSNFLLSGLLFTEPQSKWNAKSSGVSRFVVFLVSGLSADEKRRLELFITASETTTGSFPSSESDF